MREAAQPRSRANSPRSKQRQQPYIERDQRSSWSLLLCQ
nr:MAG TPA: hypothetical protein [Bacteriophage sp.]